jgi:GT2 family glycosyltransferase
MEDPMQACNDHGRQPTCPEPLSVSILIATYNRCPILLRAIESLQALRVPEAVRVELLIVANGCTDDTVERIQEQAPGMPFPMRCVTEPTLGLSHARNRAIAESQGAILAFLDDDVWVEEGWLAGLVEVFRRHPADIVVGPVALWWEAVTRPAWLGVPAQRVLSCLNHGENVMELQQSGLGIGANLALRREVVQTVGLFNPDLGRIGAQLLAGEETEYLVRALRAGKRMFYAPQAAVRHWVAPERITLAYLHKAAYGNGLVRPWLLPSLTRPQALLIAFKYSLRAAAYGVLEAAAWAGCCRKARVNHHVRRMTCWGNVVGTWRRCGRGPAQRGVKCGTDSASAPGAPFRPIFVVGHPRSGTTLLAVLLGRHSTLAMTPETHFFRLLGRRRSGERVSHDELLRRFHANRLPAELRLDAPALAARFKAGPADHACLLRAVLEQYASDHGKPRAGEKTPMHLENVETILQWYPDARIVGIVRDGRDVVLSLMSMPWADERRLRVLGWRWMRLLRLAENWKARFPQQFMLIGYEDLLRAPRQTLCQVDAFAGLAFEEQQLTSATATDVVDPRAEPWKAQAVEEIDPTRSAGWKQKATPEQIRILNSLLAPALVRRGYADTACRRRLGDYLALAWFNCGLFYLWSRVVEKNLPGRRALRRAIRRRDQGLAEPPRPVSPGRG